MAPGGRVELGGLSSAGIVTFKENGSLSFPKGIEKADVTLTNATNVDVTAGGGGSIFVNARDLELSGGELGRSRLRAGIATGSGSPEAIAGDIILNAEDTITVSQGSQILNQVLPRGLGNAGEINIATNNLSLIQGGRVDASTLGLGDAGKIDINASGTILANGNESGIASVVRVTGNGNSGEINITTTDLSLTQGGEVSASTFGQGNAGKITINASGNILVDGQDQFGITSLISSRVGATGKGNSGGIVITTNDLSLTQGGKVDSSTFGRGNAGQITINASGNILAEGGDESGIISVVRETGVGDSGEIDITTTDLSLRQGGKVDSSTFGQGDAGKITINASGNILAEGGDESGIISIVRETGVGNSGEIDITTTDLSLRQGGRVTASTFGVGDASQIIINASGNILAEGQNESGFTSRISSRVGSNAVGKSEGIEITTTNLSLTEGGTVTASTRGEGDAGAIKITTTNLSLTEGGTVTASTRGEGDAGAITIQASGTIRVEGDADGEDETGIVSIVRANAVGNSGEIKITTTDLSLRQGGRVSASTFGVGDAGKITINASGNILVEGADKSGVTSRISSRVGSNTGGKSGGIDITTTNLSLIQGGIVTASTRGQGKAGNLTVKAADSIELVGSNGEFPSGLFANAIQGNGQGGDLTITTDRLIVRDSAVISVGNFEELVAGNSQSISPGTGDAGNLEMNARSVEVINQGKITTDNANGIGGNLELNADSLILESEASISASTTADRGQGGNITLNINDTLRMGDRSLISARADKGANGGNVNINAEFIIAAPNQNNDIIASTSQGMGGNIDITAEGVFGLEARSSTPTNETNDIDASSEFGLDGNITINAPDVGTFQEAIKAPEIVQLQTLGANACARKGATETSSFTITGKGSVHAKLTEPLNSDRIFIEGESISVGKRQSERVQTEQIKPLITAQGKIYPARGIIFLKNGDIVLTAYPTNTVQRNPYSSLNCFKS